MNRTSESWSEFKIVSDFFSLDAKAQLRFWPVSARFGSGVGPGFGSGIGLGLGVGLVLRPYLDLARKHFLPGRPQNNATLKLMLHVVGWQAQ